METASPSHSEFQCSRTGEEIQNIGGNLSNYRIFSIKEKNLLISLKYNLKRNNKVRNVVKKKKLCFNSDELIGLEKHLFNSIGPRMMLKPYNAAWSISQILNNLLRYN